MPPAWALENPRDQQNPTYREYDNGYFQPTIFFDGMSGH